MIVSGDRVLKKNKQTTYQTQNSTEYFEVHNKIMGSDTIVFLMGWHFQVTAKEPEHSSLN